MQIINKKRVYDFSILNTSEFFSRIILIILMVILLASTGWMVFKTADSLMEIFPNAGVIDISKLLVINALLILAMLEIFKTTQLYYIEGRVKITYIIDTVIVGVLAEVKGFWFREFDNHRLLVVITLLLTLIIARILTMKYSPSKEEN